MQLGKLDPTTNPLLNWSRTTMRDFRANHSLCLTYIFTAVKLKNKNGPVQGMGSLKWTNLCWFTRGSLWSVTFTPEVGRCKWIQHHLHPTAQKLADNQIYWKGDLLRQARWWCDPGQGESLICINLSLTLWETYCVLAIPCCDIEEKGKYIITYEYHFTGDCDGNKSKK